jgi:hypothetical protein
VLLSRVVAILHALLVLLPLTILRLVRILVLVHRRPVLVVEDACHALVVELVLR